MVELVDKSEQSAIPFGPQTAYVLTFWANAILLHVSFSWIVYNLTQLAASGGEVVTVDGPDVAVAPAVPVAVAVNGAGVV